MFKKEFDLVMPWLKVAAPTIGSAIGGPFGAAVGYIIPVLANAFGAHPTDIKDLVQKMLENPDRDKIIQQVEHEHGDWICTLMDSTSNLTKAEVTIKLEWGKEAPAS